jgi:hypothetical protein
MPPNLDPAPNQDLSFGNVQRIQILEEKTNEALLVMRLDATILSELKQHYQIALEFEGLSDDLKVRCKEDIYRFGKHIAGIQNDLEIQTSRAEALLRLLADRKNLVGSNTSIIQFLLADRDKAVCSITVPKYGSGQGARTQSTTVSGADGGDDERHAGYDKRYAGHDQKNTAGDSFYEDHHPRHFVLSTGHFYFSKPPRKIK